jgi:D-lactate dehydrogenase (cytochrome)
MGFDTLQDEDKRYIRSIVSPERFSTGESNLDLHSRDMSGHRASRPEAVVWPKESAEVSRILGYADQRRIPVTAWGAGTSLEGNPIPLHGGIVLDFTQMDSILEIRQDDFQADVEPGVIYKDLNHKLRHTGLFFPPDPGAGATIGGMIANNASGIRTVRYGSTKDNVLRLVVVLAGGEIIEIGNRASKTSSGFDLLHLFVGSEGMLGIVVEATLRLVGLPAEIASAVATFQTVEDAGKAVFAIIRAGLDPAALELMAPECIDLINRQKNLGLHISPTLFMEFHGPTRNHLMEVMGIAEGLCREHACREFRPGLDREERDRLLEARYALGDMIRQDHPDHFRIAIDVAVPISAYPEMIAFAGETARKAGAGAAYTFGHAGDGNIHLVVETERGNRDAWQRIKEANRSVVHKALALKGTATGEHGVGIGKAQFMEAEHGRSLEWMKKVKQLLDPHAILNPGKMFP